MQLNATYEYDFLDGVLLCKHEEYEIEKACCSTRGSSGYIECGCGGVDSIICLNKECTGITEEDVENILDTSDVENDCAS